MGAGAYFPGDEPALSGRLDSYLAGLGQRLAQASFARDVKALVLAGGYGRGEGGVFRAGEEGEARLYNDLEFYLLLETTAAQAAASAWCVQEAHAGDSALGLEVEFKLLTAAELTRATPSMFYYDLLAAHRLVWGDGRFLAGLPAQLRDPSQIPSHEATRLLFNRGSGLFFSRCALETPGDPRASNGFIERNHAKVRLALADAILAVNGRYHWSCRERARRLGETLERTPPDWAVLARWHAAGVEFKLHPRHLQPSPVELARAQRQLAEVWLRTFLWLESLRLGRPLETPQDYARGAGRLFPHLSAARGVMLHLRDRLQRGGALPGWFDYPRAALQRAVVLLAGPVVSATELAGAARLTRASTATWPAIEAAYLRWWRWYN